VYVAGSDIYRCFVKVDLMHACVHAGRRNNAALVSYMTFRGTIYKGNAVAEV